MVAATRLAWRAGQLYDSAGVKTGGGVEFMLEGETLSRIVFDDFEYLSFEKLLLGGAINAAGTPTELRLAIQVISWAA